MINGLDLFSGIGGITLALEKWITPITYCERDRYAQAVLLSRMREGAIPIAPIWDDITTLSQALLPRGIDIIYGGFPCQDISVAGNGKGLGGERSGLFFEIMRLVREIKPTFVFLENVPAIRTRGLDTVLREFTEAGYDCRWTMLSAAEVGAPHKRERWFLLAYSNSNTNGKQYLNEKKGRDNKKLNNEMADTLCKGLEGQRKKSLRIHETYTEDARSFWWETEPSICRVVDGLPARVDRIKCLGNAVVPVQVKEAFKELIGI